jgi:Gpi18-like mannosyltransferase
MASPPVELHSRFVAIWIALAIVGTLSLLVAGGPVARFSDELAAWPFLDMWARWDAQWYRSIALEGYFFDPARQSSVAFFPLYPLLIRGMVWLGFGPLSGGIVLTTLLGTSAFAVFSKWASHFGPEHTARLAGWVLAVWPLAFFLYGAVYSDALFLLLVCGAFLCLEKGHPALTMVLGIAATATRPVGPAVVVGLLVRSIELRVRNKQPLRAVDLLPALAGLGLLAYMVFQYVKFGTPTAFIETQSSWDQTPGPRTWFKLNFIFGSRFLERLPRALMHLGLVSITLSMLGRIWRKLGAGYAVYVAMVAGMPLLSSIDFIGLGRYALAGFPALFCFAGFLEERPKLARVWFPISVVLLGICVSKFSLGRYIS